MVHTLLVQARYLAVLRCSECQRAISRGIEETDQQWAYRTEAFLRAHSNEKPVTSATTVMSSVSVEQAFIACQICGATRWKEMFQPASEWLAACTDFRLEHTHG